MIDINSALTLISRDGRASLPLSRSVIALGTFDGVHIAHRALIREAAAMKERIGAELLGVWCFEESPAVSLLRENSRTLTDKKEKQELLLECGADVVIMAKFEHFRDMSAEDFISEILISRLCALGTVCGYDHRFGHMGLGDTSTLIRAFGRENAIVIPEIRLYGETVSSSAIRDHLSRGEISAASAMLGRAVSFSAEIGHGKKLGRKLGFPTANQMLPRTLSMLRHGVYATRCRVDGHEYIGVANVGIRPSISDGDDHTKNCETYLLNFSGELYGKQMTVEFCEFLRDEKNFSSLDELCRAIERDKQKTEELLKK